ncbi:hypothetical protein CHUAL_001575 [Chamberlinius hualienensis]
MNQIITKILLIVFVSSLFVAQSFQDNFTCSLKCTIYDQTFDCWEDSENYIVEQVVNAVNNLTGLEIMIERWRNETNTLMGNLSAYVDDVVNRIDKFGMNTGPLDKSTMNRIMTVVVYEVLNWTQSHPISLQENLYGYYCPVSCDYYKTMWMYLFICVTVILILTLIYITVYVHHLRSSLRKRRLL